ncbi:hypothetical protein P9209_23680 [Prescottella defluvii]|nr:hypothetical protein P9209_23680 [Prescottella defluvii]
MTASMACIMSATAVQGVVRDEPVVILIAPVLALVFGFATVGLAGLGGFRYLGLSKRIVVCHDEIGEGIEVPTRKYLVPLFVSLAAVAVIGLAVAAGWLFGFDVGPLEARDSGQAKFMTACGIAALILLALFLGFRSSTSIRLYPSGIRRIVALRRLWSTRTIDTFVSWDDIVEFQVDEQVVGGLIEVRNPIIWLVSGMPLPGRGRLRYDETNRLRLDAHVLVAEPNVLLGLLSSLRESPDRRRALTGARARALLTPAPLRSRLRAASSADGSEVS